MPEPAASNKRTYRTSAPLHPPACAQLPEDEVADGEDGGRGAGDGDAGGRGGNAGTGHRTTRQFRFADMRAGRSIARDVDMEELDEGVPGNGARAEEPPPENATEEVRRGLCGGTRGLEG